MDKEVFNIDFLMELLNNASVSGFEQSVSKVFSDYLKPFSNNVETDKIGNTYAYLEGGRDSNGDSTIMIEAHCDEIGFQVLYISDDGYIYIRKNGGIDMACVPGSKMIIQSKNGYKINGVIGKKPIHFNEDENNKCHFELSQLWVDSGLSADEVRQWVSIGDPVAFAPNFSFLGKSKITSKSLDDKVGLYIIAEVLRSLSLKDNRAGRVVAVSTVQEEVGCRGATIAGYTLNPNIAITVDVDFATDVPDLSPNAYGDISLGKGVVIHKNVDVDIKLSDIIENLAKTNHIPYQISSRPRATGGTNASRLQLIRSGISTISLGIPCRYMHTPVEMCDINDMMSAIKLIVCFCESENR